MRLKIDRLVMKTFKGYKAASNNNFVEYILKEKDTYLEGTAHEAAKLI